MGLKDGSPALLAPLSSGLILGLSTVIYAVSYAALMCSGELSPYVAYGLTITLVTAAVGGLYGLFAEEPSFVNGPDSNTSSVLAGMMVALATTPPPGMQTLHAAVALLLVASVSTALTYLLIERFGAARLVRFIPFQVMAGFLASTGWLMSSGALNIIAGTPLTLEGLAALMERPARAELAVGVLLMIALSRLARRFSAALVFPVFIVAASIAVNVVTRLICPASPLCAADLWFFQPFERLQWLPPWRLQADGAMVLELLALVPSFVALAFVATLTVLLSLSSLELTYKRDFKLEPALRLHGRMTLVTAFLGGYMGVISIGRSQMCRQTGGGRWTGLVISAVCLAVLFGLGWVMAWIPKAALGALVLYLGVGMLRQWLWDLRHDLSKVDMLQIVSILVCVIVFGYVVGFLAGLLAACIFSHAKVIDQSAISVLQKIVRNEALHHKRLILTLNGEIEPMFAQVAMAAAADRPVITHSFDAALEVAEEIRDSRTPTAERSRTSSLKFLDSREDQQAFAAFLKEVHLDQGDTLFEEGQASDKTYFVESGRLEVVKTGLHHTPIRLAKVVAGSMIGEMALYSGRPRTASVIAVEAVMLRVLTHAGWIRMQAERPDLARRFDRHVILTLANTVSRTSAALSQQEG